MENEEEQPLMTGTSNGDMGGKKILENFYSEEAAWWLDKM